MNKADLKEKRRKAFQQKQERLARLPYRRKGKLRNEKLNLFRSWFVKKRNWEFVQDRLAKKANKPWLIKVSILVERLPQITPDVPKWEQDFLDLRAYLDQFEGMKFPEDGPFKEANYDNEIFIKSEQSFLKSLTKGYTIRDRITESDKTNDIHSLDRKLSTRIYLILPKETFYFPTTTVKEDETILQAAQRVISEKVGNDLELYCPSNCPMAVDMKLNSDQEEFWGEKIFFMRVQRDRGDVLNLEKDEYAWLDREEVVDKVKNERGEYTSKFYHYLL